MKRALLLYWHGLGDVIILTPLLRHLYQTGYKVDLMCRREVRTSRLLDDCPYVEKLIDVENPWRSKKGFQAQFRENVVMFEKMGRRYDWSGKCVHRRKEWTVLKVDANFEECDLPVISRKPQVFIPSEMEKAALAYIEQNYPDGYVYRHTDIEFHDWHSWDCSDYINEKFPGLPVINTGAGGEHYMINENINFTFVLAREARHRVLSSSFIVHACEAMDCRIDVIHYGKPDRKVWLNNHYLVKEIIEAGKRLPAT